jgi:hypothetical protein
MPSPLRNRRRQRANGKVKEERHQNLLICAGVRPSARFKFMKYFKGFTPPEIIGNYKLNGKSYNIGELQIYASTMGITAYGCPLHVVQMEILPRNFQGFWVNYIAPPCEW